MQPYALQAQTRNAPEPTARIPKSPKGCATTQYRPRPPQKPQAARQARPARQRIQSRPPSSTTGFPYPKKQRGNGACTHSTHPYRQNTLPGTPDTSSLQPNLSSQLYDIAPAIPPMSRAMGPLQHCNGPTTRDDAPWRHRPTCLQNATIRPDKRDVECIAHTKRMHAMAGNEHEYPPRRVRAQ